MLQGSPAQILLPAAQRSDETVLRVAGREYALGMASQCFGQESWWLRCPCRRGSARPLRKSAPALPNIVSFFAPAGHIRTTFSLMLLLVTVFVFFSSVWLALFLSKQITRPVEALADAMDEIAAGKYEYRVSDTGHRRNG